MGQKDAAMSKFLTQFKSYRDLVRVMDFLRRIKIRPIHFSIPVICSLAASFFEGISVSLLVPFLKGAIEMNFAFARELPGLKNLITLFPPDLEKRNATIFVILLTTIFVSAMLKNVFTYLSSLTIAWQIRKFAHNLRCAIFERYLSFGKLFFDRQNLGYLAQVLVGHTNNIANTFGQINSIINSFFMLLVYLAMMFWISWQMSFLIFLAFPVFNYSVAWIIKRIWKTSESQARSDQELSKKMYSILSCILLVKAYSRETEEHRHYEQLSGEVRALQFSMDKKTNFISPINEMMMLATLLILISFMTYLIVKVQAGTIAGFLVYFYLIRRTLNMAGVFNHAKAVMASIRGAMREIQAVFDDQDKFFVPDGKRAFEALRHEICFKHASFAYLPQNPILQNLSLTIEKGKMTAIVGPSGSGKTTVINLILRFYDCKPECLFIDGTDIREFTLKSLRNHMALVSQETFLFNDTLKNNITFGLNGSVDEKMIWNAVDKAQLGNYIRHLPDQLETIVGDRGVKLSGGEKQRVAIARAILKKAEILILDEATSALDSQTEKLIQKAINEAVRDRTAIVIAHRLSTIKHADKIAVLDNGRIVEDGTLNELLARKGKFYQYWEEQKFF
jgi:subfamily B ATP-binding cassette protein MsbA